MNFFSYLIFIYYFVFCISFHFKIYHFVANFGYISTVLLFLLLQSAVATIKFGEI